MELIAALSDLCSQHRKPIIAIDGPAGAGKTTLANSISMALSKDYSVQIIHMDDLYNGWDFALSNELTSTLEELTYAHATGTPYKYRKYDWSNNAFGPYEESEPCSLLILEGVGSGQRAIRDRLATLIWVDIPPEDGLNRVLNRDGKNIEPNMRKWLTAQSEHFAADSTQEESEFIFTN
jgi:uridine kinase